MTIRESEIQAQVADYLRLRYPDVLFHSDLDDGKIYTIAELCGEKEE